jgi:FixJ family two-component response regulator
MHFAPSQSDTRNSEDVLTVAVVDDDADSRKQVQIMLGGPNSCFNCEEFESPEAFYDADLESCDLLVFDEYYQETRVRRAAELVEHGITKYPGVPIIILSDYPDPTSIARSELVTAFVDKLKANQDPSHFRTEVSRALRSSETLSQGRLQQATRHLLKKDSEDAESEDRISDIALDRVIYPFRNPLTVTTEWTDELSNCSFSLKDYPGFLTGTGPDRGSARLTFYARFHERFQQLFTQSEIYDTPDEDADRRRLIEIIDVDQYQSLRTAFVPHWIGQIKQVDSDGTRHIAWLRGPTTAHRLDEVPSLANLREGEWLKAALEKRLATGAIVRVLNVSKTSEPIFSRERRDAFWNPKPQTSK